ncbi:MAG TPA: CPBP family intramembrane glutamic endopeptidase [Roseiflexaceae bacterium]|nr:CPBP family intramembrane glutamic endopeptidase [Roseiflexaceae bacterium]
MVQLIKRHPVLSYCALVMVWSFSWWSLILTVVPIGRLFDPPINGVAIGLMLLGGIGPSLAGLVLTRIVEGNGSVRALLARLGHWRVGRWWLAPLIPFALNIALVLLYGKRGGQVVLGEIAQKLGPAIVLGLFAGLSEEFGWRGFLLPQLQTRFRPLASALLIGLIWGGVWHFFANYLGAFGNRGWWGLWLDLVQAPILLSAYSVMLTWLYNHTRGSMLLCVTFHMAISSSAFLLGPQYPSSSIYLVWAIVFSALAWVAAGALVLLARRQEATWPGTWQRA